MTSRVQEVQRLGQSVWYDNIRRGLIRSGELQKLIDVGVSGVTSNPTIFEKAIAGSTDYDEALLGLAQDAKSTQELFEALAIEDIRAAADLLRPVYDRTNGADGYASLEVSPELAHNTGGTISEAKRLFAALDRPNVMVKVPATPEGISAIRHLIGQGININVMLIFSLDAYQQVGEAYIAGLEDLARTGGEVSKVASVASFFVSRVDTAVDGQLEEGIRDGREDLKDLLGKAAIANAKLAYRDFKVLFGDERFAALREKGAMVQRPLWASTGTKSPAYSDVLYVESLIGPDTVNTVPPATLSAFLDHGGAGATLEQDVEEAARQTQSLAAAGIDIEQITAKLLADGLESFAESFRTLLANIEDKKARLLARPHAHPGVSLGSYLPDVEASLAEYQRREVMARLWRGDHTVWKPDPTEITNRLGWLTVTDTMCDQAPALDAFAREVRDTGFRHVALLGMGGSSLGPEVLRQAFGSAPGYPELIVLDSTVPGWVREVTEAVNPARTIFLVSSKSGSTTEPNTFYAHFRGLVEKAAGPEQVGRSFVAITDPGTPLEKLAREKGFRRVFLNPPDIGGRYSVLSYFGLVPAALSGIDIGALLGRADSMREGCASCVPAHDNPGAWLGTAMGTLARQGRDKLTLVTSPGISGFGLWVEQLIAESTGKEGTGIVPIAGEPLSAPVHYGKDRFFVYLRLEGDDDSGTDAAVDAIEASGQPVVRLDLRDRYDLGAEFFRWEFATVVAGAVLGIHPFDQPNVQAAKEMTESVLRQYTTSGQLPYSEPPASFKGLVAGAGPGSYLAIMAYIRQTPEVNSALDALRRRVMARYGIATTFGYGPRFLHSTGQLHKGGPSSGLFLQLTADHQGDVPIPGEPYTFSILADAQAVGDLQALQAAGRSVARVHLGSSGEAGILGLAAELA
jgi:transaldolase/glucose-6-phosphate isomerase